MCGRHCSDSNGVLVLSICTSHSTDSGISAGYSCVRKPAQPRVGSPSHISPTAEAVVLGHEPSGSAYWWGGSVSTPSPSACQAARARRGATLSLSFTFAYIGLGLPLQHLSILKFRPHQRYTGSNQFWPTTSSVSGVLSSVSVVEAAGTAPASRMLIPHSSSTSVHSIYKPSSTICQPLSDDLQEDRVLVDARVEGVCLEWIDDLLEAGLGGFGYLIHDRLRLATCLVARRGVLVVACY